MATKKQQWLDYLAELTLYRETVKAYAQALPDDDGSVTDASENPEVPRPPQPPH